MSLREAPEICQFQDLSKHSFLFSFCIILTSTQELALEQCLGSLPTEVQPLDALSPRVYMVTLSFKRKGKQGQSPFLSHSS